MSDIHKALDCIVMSILKARDTCPASAESHLNQALYILHGVAPDWKPCDDDARDVVRLAIYEMELLSNGTGKPHESKPVIVIDFDDTLTAMPDFWRQVIGLAKSYGQRVICMTQRTQDEFSVGEVYDWMEEHNIELPTYFTNGASKVWYIEEVLKFEKYILCDDNPKRAVNGV